MFKRVRIVVLLYVLVFVAAAQFFAARHARNWDAPLWVDLYLVDGDGKPVTQRYLKALDRGDFEDTEEFFAREAARFGLGLSQPFRLRVIGELPEPLPALAPDAGALGILQWSLRMRWLATRLKWRDQGPSGDIVAFVVFHEAAGSLALDRSTALEKGLIAVVNLFADRDARGPNQLVLAHELLHTLGATDKYSAATNAPTFPDGYAAPEAKPLLPQKKAELMAGRIPIDAATAEIPDSLRQVVIGPATAREIGWQR